jgi:hypothetical protein
MTTHNVSIQKGKIDVYRCVVELKGQVYQNALLAFREVAVLMVQFVDSVHYFRERVIERIRCINGTSVIIEILETGFPLQPLLPGRNLELEYLALTSLKAMFLHLRRALAMDNQQRKREFLSQCL